MPGNHNFIMYRASAFQPTLNYQSPSLVTKAITAITKSARTRLTVPSHSLPGTWKVFVSGVGGMKQLNNRDLTRIDQARTAEVIDANTITLDIDSNEFGAYTSGGELVYHPPIDLTGYHASMDIRTTFDATTSLLALTDLNGGISLGGVAGTIGIYLSVAAVNALAWTNAVYVLTLTPPSGKAKQLMYGNIVVSRQ